MNIKRRLADTPRKNSLLPYRELVAIGTRTTTFNLELAEILVTAVIIVLLAMCDLVAFGILMISTPTSAPVQESQNAPRVEINRNYGLATVATLSE